VQRNALIYNDKARLQGDLETASAYIGELENKIYETNGTSLELLDQLRLCENEIETLKSYIFDLKGRIAVYIPVKSD
jgi:hypothetical protein